MQTEFSRFRPIARRLLSPGLATLLAAFALPSSAAEETIIEWRDAARVISSAVSHYYHGTVRRDVIEAACYLDPSVEGSMRCSWSGGSGNVDSYKLKQRAKRNATKWCKKAGGRECVLFWRNGKLQFDGLSSEQSEKLRAVLDKIPDYDSKAAPLPEGVGVDSRFRNGFPKLRDRLEEHRRKRRGRNPHYAICTNEKGPWTTFRMAGRGTFMEKVREMCVLKCKAFSDYLSKEGDCYVTYEDGEFASEAAEKAVMQ